MASIIENKKGFKIIELSITELNQIGGLGICDSCNSAAFSGYYIAVLNMWYCPNCYHSFLERAKWYQEDSKIENQNFENMCKTFNLNPNGTK